MQLAVLGNSYTLGTHCARQARVHGFTVQRVENGSADNTEAAMAGTLEGTHAVIVLEDFVADIRQLAHVLSEMERAGSRRLVLLFHQAVQLDLRSPIGRLLRVSSVDWTLVHASIEDIADAADYVKQTANFLVKQITDTTHLHAAVAVRP